MYLLRIVVLSLAILGTGTAVMAQRPVPGELEQPVSDLWAGATADDQAFIDAFLEAKQASLDAGNIGNLRSKLQMFRWERRMRNKVFVQELKSTAMESMAFDAVASGSPFAFADAGPERWRGLDPEQWEKILAIAMQILELILKFI